MFVAVAAAPYLAAAANIPADQLAVFEQSTEAQQIRIMISLAKQGSAEEAEFLLQRYPLQGEHAQNRTLFIRGLVQKAKGELTAAAKTFRQALANDPKLTLVRSELAQTLYELEEDESAIHHLKLLQADAPDAATAAGIKAFIDTIDARTPFKFNAYIAAAPTSNVNSGSIRKSIFGGQDITNRRKSGVGAAVGTNASYSGRFGDDWFLIASGGIDARVYDRSEFNTLTVSEAIEARHLTDEGFIGFAAVASQSVDTDAEELDYLSYGPRLTFRHAIAGNGTFGGSALFEFRDYPDAAVQDSTALKLDANWTGHWDSTASITLSPGFTRVRTNDLSSVSFNFDYDTLSLGVNGYKELTQGITLDAGLELQETRFTRHFANQMAKRKDSRLVGTISLTKRDLNIFGFAPSLSYTFTRNRSNYDFFDFNIHEVDLRLTKEF